jgi:signal peptidase
MLAFVWRTTVWLVLLAAAAALAAAVAVPRLTGATPYAVSTGSMQPDYPPGTLVVVKPLPVDEIDRGDVVTYQLESGEAAVVTHRVVEVGTTLDGELQLTTQGDANDIPDAEPVQPVQVKGRLWYSVPYLGYVNNVVSGAERRIGVYVAVFGLLGYAAYMFVSAARDRRRRRRDDEPAGETTQDPTTV